VLSRGKKAAELPKASSLDFPAVRARGMPAGLQTIIDYALQQSLIPRKIAVEDLFDDTTRALES
jgi:4,5-dihydroxyphthalate decarboxylase